MPPLSTLDNVRVMHNNDDNDNNAAGGPRHYQHQYQARHCPASSSSSSGRSQGNHPPPSYRQSEWTSTYQEHRQEDPFTRSLTWADIEKGIEEGRWSHSDETARVQRQTQQAFTQSRLSGTSHTHSSFHTSIVNTLSKARSLLPFAAFAAHPAVPPSPTTPTQAPSLSPIASAQSLQEAKRSMSTHLYKSIPIRLLAYAILFFNTLLVIRVMADPAMYPYSINGGRDGLSESSRQIRLGSDNDIQTRFPCVAATSHNDEMQAAPFSEAMSLGITSIEVDTWLQDGTLLAGHEAKDLSRGKTVKAIYLDPLFKMLERTNVDSERIQDWQSEDWKGVFPLSPKQELMLMIDVKNDPKDTFNKTLELLRPFIEKNYLTVYKEGVLVQGPITIVGTGDTPLDLVLSSSPRYIFYDAPLVRIQYPITDPTNGQSIEWAPEIAPIASSKWLWWNYYPNVEALKVFSDNAHSRGIKARWWGVARWPAYFRRALWGLQLKAEVDIINADDLADVAAFLRAKEDAKEDAKSEEQTSRKAED